MTLWSFWSSSTFSACLCSLSLSSDRELYRSDNRLLSFDLTDTAVQGMLYCIMFNMHCTGGDDTGGGIFQNAIGL